MFANLSIIGLKANKTVRRLIWFQDFGEGIEAIEKILILRNLS